MYGRLGSRVEDRFSGSRVTFTLLIWVTLILMVWTTNTYCRDTESVLRWAGIRFPNGFVDTPQ